MSIIFLFFCSICIFIGNACIYITDIFQCQAIEKRFFRFVKMEQIEFANGFPLGKNGLEWNLQSREIEKNGKKWKHNCNNMECNGI